MATSRPVAGAAAGSDALGRGAERILRLAGDARTGIALLLVTGLVNAVAAFLPDGPATLDGWPYAVLLGALALSGVAAVAVRAPAVWREWHRPGAVQSSGLVLRSVIEGASAPDALMERLGQAGYRVRLERRRDRWAIHGVRRGWSRFAGLVSHLALVVIVLGAAIGAAFGSETTFSLMTGEQALLDAPRAGFSSAIRLEGFDAAFGTDGRPSRLDTTVSLIRDGEVVRETLLRVNEPADFDGYLVHPWTYGPAVRLRVTTLGGTPLLDTAVPLAEERDGLPVGSASLPTAGATLGLVLADSDAGVLGVSVLGPSGVADTTRLRPGDERRVGDLMVGLVGFDAWVTFLSRRDPGMAILFLGAALLCAALAVGFWWPRRRVTVRPVAAGVELRLRGERFDRPGDEFARLRRILAPT